MTVISVIVGSTREGRFGEKPAQWILQHLMKREPPLVKVLPRLPGTKEARYAHLLSGDTKPSQAGPRPEAVPSSLSDDAARVAILEERISALEKEIAELRQQFLIFRKQFE